jgi:hypothetical protein
MNLVDDRMDKHGQPVHVLGSSYASGRRRGQSVLVAERRRFEEPFLGMTMVAGMLHVVGEPVMIGVERAHRLD